MAGLIDVLSGGPLRAYSSAYNQLWNISNSNQGGMKMTAYIRDSGRTAVLLIMILLAVASAMDLAAQERPGDGASAQLSPQDIEFMKKAAVGAMLEIQLGQLAQKKAQNPEVQQFGQRMVREHQKAAKNLKQMAKNLGVQLPTSLPEQRKALKDALAELDPEDFDGQYMWNMVAVHTVAVNLFENEIEQGQHPKVVQMANRVLPTLKDHRSRAVDLWNELSY
jgi:putative membrane protein